MLNKIWNRWYFIDYFSFIKKKIIIYVDVKDIERVVGWPLAARPIVRPQVCCWVTNYLRQWCNLGKAKGIYYHVLELSVHDNKWLTEFQTNSANRHYFCVFVNTIQLINYIVILKIRLHTLVINSVCSLI